MKLINIDVIITRNRNTMLQAQKSGRYKKIIRDVHFRWALILEFSLNISLGRGI